MQDISLERLVYFSLLGTALVFMVFVRGRHSLSKGVRDLAIWALIFVGMIAAVGMWNDIRGSVAPRQQVMQEAGAIALPQARDGHYYATAQVNGTPIRFVVDTGATGIVLSRADAARAGIDTERLAFVGQAYTANGVVSTAPVTLDSLALGPIEDRGVRAFVNGGAMDGSLLGMTYLQRFARVEIADGRMVLHR